MLNSISFLLFSVSRESHSPQYFDHLTTCVFVPLLLDMDIGIDLSAAGEHFLDTISLWNTYQSDVSSKETGGSGN